MYFLWFLAAAAVLAVGLGLKKLFFPADKRLLSPFQQSRPLPDLSSPPDQDLAEKVQSGLLKLAQPHHEEFVSSAAHNDLQQAQAFTSPRTVEPVAETAGAAMDSAKNSAGSGGHRISTWGDRRLFSEFRGILSENENSLCAAGRRGRGRRQ